MFNASLKCVIYERIFIFRDHPLLLFMSSRRIQETFLQDSLRKTAQFKPRPSVIRGFRKENIHIFYDYFTQQNH